MGHVQDRWYKKVVDPATGKAEKVRTDLFGKGLRYKVRYLAPDGQERSRMFPDRCKRQADDFLLEIESTKREGRYVDPRAGRTRFRQQAKNWLKSQSPDAASREVISSRLNSQIYPHFGDLPLSAVKPATVRDWLGVLDEKRLSRNYRAVLFTALSSILDSAVEDRLIIENPCKSKSIKKPVGASPDIVVWPEERVRAIGDALAERFRIVCTLGAGCGLRQGEILGVSLDDVDRAAGALTVQRQIRVVGRQLVFAPPKGDKRRVVPLAPGVVAAMREHDWQYPGVTVTLPWKDPAGEPVTARLLVTGEAGRLYTGDLFHKVVWQAAFRAAGIEYRSRADGMHALRHFYASTLLSRGVSVKELAEYLGHSDPGFTLRTYTHLVPSSHERARAAVEAVFGRGADDGLEAA